MDEAGHAFLEPKLEVCSQINTKNIINIKNSMLFFKKLPFIKCEIVIISFSIKYFKFSSLNYSNVHINDIKCYF